MNRRSLLLGLPLLIAACGEPPMLGQKDPLLDREDLTAQFQKIADRLAPGSLGVAVEDLSTGQIVSFNGERRFPLAGVARAPLGAAVLAEVEAGHLRLGDMIEVRDVDLSPPPSAVADAWPGRTAYTVNDLLERALADDDNTAADLLLKRIGGPGAVTAWLQGRKVRDIRLDRYARQLGPDSLGVGSFRADWKGEAAWREAIQAVPASDRRRATLQYLADPRDTATPLGVVRFLEALNQGELLSPASRQVLGRLSSRPASPPGGLRAALPDGARLAHQAGSARMDLGFTPVVNDIGVYTLKDGRRFAVAVFVAGSPKSLAEQDAAIAEVGRVVIKAAK